MFTEETYNWLREDHRQARLNDIQSHLYESDEVHWAVYVEDVIWLLSERAKLVRELDDLRREIKREGQARMRLKEVHDE
jgi:chromosome segregation ATPase